MSALSLLIIALLAICNIAIDSYANAKNAHARSETTEASNDDDRKPQDERTDKENGEDDKIDELIDCLASDPSTWQNDACKENQAAKGIIEGRSILGNINDNLRKTGDRLENSINNTQKCIAEEWENAYDIRFEGCKQPNIGDVAAYEWKLWEDALRDGDICIKTDADGNKMAVMKEEC